MFNKLFCSIGLHDWKSIKSPKLLRECQRCGKAQRYRVNCWVDADNIEVISAKENLSRKEEKELRNYTKNI